MGNTRITVPRRGLQLRLEDNKQRPNHRRHGRVHCELLKCYVGQTKLGSVQDLSLSGVRIRRKFLPLPVQPDQRLNVLLATPNAQLVLLSRVVWSRRMGLFSQELGMEFVDVDAKQRASILQMMKIAGTDRPQ